MPYEPLTLGDSVRKFLALLKRYRIQLILLVIFFLALGLVYYHTLSITHTATVIIEPGLVGMDYYKHFIYNDTPQNLAYKIRKGTYTPPILGRLGALNKELKFDVSFNIKGDALMIKYSDKSEAFALAVLKQLIEEIIKEKEPYVENLKKSLDEQINSKQIEKELLKHRINELTNNIKSKQEEIRNIDALRTQTTIEMTKRENKIKELEATKKYYANLIDISREAIKKLQGETSNVERVSKDLQEGRKNLLNPANVSTDLVLNLLLFDNTIQNNVEYYIKLYNQLTEEKESIESNLKELASLEMRIENTKKEIEEMKIKRDEIYASQIEEKRLEIKNMENEIQNIIPSKIENTNTEIKRLEIEKNQLYPLKIVLPPTIQKTTSFSLKMTLAVFFIVGLLVSILLLSIYDLLKESPG